MLRAHDCKVPANRTFTIGDIRNHDAAAPYSARESTEKKPLSRCHAVIVLVLVPVPGSAADQHGAANEKPERRELVLRPAFGAIGVLLEQALHVREVLLDPAAVVVANIAVYTAGLHAAADAGGRTLENGERLRDDQDH